MGDGRWNTSTRIIDAMAVEEIAAAVALSLNLEAGFPFTATAALGVVTLRHQERRHGRQRPQPDLQLASAARLRTVGLEMTVCSDRCHGTQTAATAPDYQAILGECCYCCIGMLYDAPAWQDAMIEYIASAWSCLKPQCFGHGYTYNSGTLGQILASDTNSAEVCRLAHCSGDPSLGWLKVAALRHAVLLLDRRQPGDVDPGPELRRAVLRQARRRAASSASRLTSSSFCRRPASWSPFRSPAAPVSSPRR